MSKKKGLIRLLLVLALIMVLVLAACGGDDDDDDKDADSTATAQAEQTATAEAEADAEATAAAEAETADAEATAAAEAEAADAEATAAAEAEAEAEAEATAVAEAAAEDEGEGEEAALEFETKDLIACDEYDLSDVQIGLVTDVGQINDKSFNQSSWEGVLSAELCGAKVSYIETQDAADYADNIAEFAENDYNIVVTVGYALGSATLEAAELYPDVFFIGVDQFQAEPVENVVGLVFNEDQSGFLAGVLAARLSETGTIAAVLGTDQIPAVVAFKEGYEAGARYVNPDINFISTYHPGSIDQAFTDPEWGATTSKQALDQNADVVFAAGGKTGNGGLIEVANAVGDDGPPPYCIGVDTDQWLTVPEAHPCLISSAMKLLDVGVSDIIKMSADDAVVPGNYFGAAALAPFHDFDSVVSDEVKAELEELAAGLADGSVSTGYGVAAEDEGEAEAEGEEAAAEDEGEEAAPAEGEGEEFAPAEGEGEEAAAEDEGEEAAPAETDLEAAPAEGEGEEAAAEDEGEAEAEGEEAAPAELMDLMDTAAADGRFTTLALAIELTGLEETFRGEGPYTVFLPTDAAFEAVPEEQVGALLADPMAMISTLQYHVVPGAMLAEDLMAAETLATVQGTDLAVTVDGDSVLLNGVVPVIESDIMASNGVIHVIDGVLMLPVEDEEVAAEDEGEEVAAEDEGEEAAAEDEGEEVAAEDEGEEAAAEDEGETVAAGSDDLGVIVVGMNAEYQPFEFVDEDGNVAGFDVDLLTAIAEAGEFEFEIVNTRWDGIFVALASGEFDMVQSAATITEEREEIVDFSEPYFNAGQMIAVRESDAATINTPEDLPGLRVGVQQGTTGDIAASEIEGVEVVRYDEITLAFQALEAGTIDAIVNDGPVNADIIAKNPDLGVVQVGDPFTDELYGIAVQPDNPELLDTVNMALAEVIADGTYAEIYMEWFGSAPPSMFMPAE